MFKKQQNNLMRNLLIFFIVIFGVGFLFFLPITINSFTNDSPLYPKNEQKVINNDYTNEINADFVPIKSTQNEKYTGAIEHIFTHCLIAYPEIAYTSTMAKDYKRDCITSSQFQNLIEQLYKNNYILIDINSIYKEQDGKIVKSDIYLPKGKKPIVLSFDDVVYDSKKMKTGMVDKISLNSNGEIVSETNENWQNGSQKIVQSKTSEFVSILNEFVKKHPDFSFNNAKGTICLTGFDGILGYRTSRRNTKNRQEEIEKAKQVCAALKKDGWNFACHSYGHYHMKKITDEKFAEELSLWKSEVESIIGKTSIYVYPYGEWEIFDDNYNFTQKHKMLQEAGFKLFCGVGTKQFFGYLPFKNTKNKVLFMDRTPIDGYTLKNQQKQLSRFFDVSSIV